VVLSCVHPKLLKFKFTQGLTEHCDFCWKGSCAHNSTSLHENVKQSWNTLKKADYRCHRFLPLCDSGSFRSFVINEKFHIWLTIMSGRRNFLYSLFFMVQVVEEKLVYYSFGRFTCFCLYIEFFIIHICKVGM
jgi:hypothetical protein